VCAITLITYLIKLIEVQKLIIVADIIREHWSRSNSRRSFREFRARRLRSIYYTVRNSIIWDLRVIAPIEYHPCHFGVNTWLSSNRRAKVRSEAMFANSGVTLSEIRGGLSCLWGTVGKFQRRSFSRGRWRASAFLTRNVTRTDSEDSPSAREVARDAMTLSDLSPDLKTPSTCVSRRYLKWGLTKWFWPIEERGVLSFTLISYKTSGRAEENLDALQKLIIV